MKKIFYTYLALVVLISIALAFQSYSYLFIFLIVNAPLCILGLRDLIQNSHAIKKNFPIIGNLRYLFEEIRPEINQYFIESNTGGRPFSREQRSLVYQRAKKQLDTIPFGTQQDFYMEGYEFINHSMYPTHIDQKSLRTTIGGDDCTQPYSASILNISAMSYGSLSKEAVMALNGGAQTGGFAHNTGEGGISPYHLSPGGDLIWQIGTGYFGCRTHDGKFNPELFQLNSQKPNVKMIEIKLSQGAKPGHGGILPAKKVTEEISKIRHVPMGKDVISPPGHSAFHDAESLVYFIKQLRELSGGKPVGIKLCLGHESEFEDLIVMMKKLNIFPDFITIDAAEGGTGAAPLEFSNYIGTPGRDALIFVVDKLVEHGVREKIKVIATGKISSAFDIIRLLCMGADATYAARSMLLALGCIQALKCNSNICPTGVATQDPDLRQGLHVPTKTVRVKNFHNETLKMVAEMVGAMGLKSHADLTRDYLKRRRHNFEIQSYSEIAKELSRK